MSAPYPELEPILFTEEEEYCAVVMILANHRLDILDKAVADLTGVSVSRVEEVRAALMTTRSPRAVVDRSKEDRQMSALQVIDQMCVLVEADPSLSFAGLETQLGVADSTLRTGLLDCFRTYRTQLCAAAADQRGEKEEMIDVDKNLVIKMEELEEEEQQNGMGFPYDRVKFENEAGETMLEGSPNFAAAGMDHFRLPKLTPRPIQITSLSDMLEKNSVKNVHQCSQCDYSFHTVSSLKRHIAAKHEGIRYPCDLCDFTATRLSDVKKHKEYKHEGIKYQCDMCEHAATTSSNLKKHKRSKHEAKFYSCDMCIYTAPLKSSLNKHIESKHRKIRYSCDLCPYSASQAYDLKRHKQSKHEGVRYPCPMCNFSGTRLSYLKKHIAQHHTVEELEPLEGPEEDHYGPDEHDYEEEHLTAEDMKPVGHVFEEHDSPGEELEPLREGPTKHEFGEAVTAE